MTTLPLAHPDDRKLKRFADGASAPAESATVGRHLAACERCRATVSFMRGLSAAARDLPAPLPPDGMLARILAERAAGERVLLPGGEEPAATPRRRWRRGLVAGLTAAALVAVASRAGQRAISPTSPGLAAAEDSLPTLGGVLSSFSVLPNEAAAQDLTGPEMSYPPARDVDATRLRPATWTYELRTVRGGRLAVPPERGIVRLDRAEYQGRPAWRLYDAWTGHPHDTKETTILDGATLRPLHRQAYDVGFSRFTVEQWFTRDSIHGTMRSANRSRLIARRIPSRGGPFLAGEASPLLMLQAIRLEPGWRGRASLLGWGAARSDLAYPFGLRLTGEDRVRTAAGPVDCWRVVLGTGPREHTFWLRKTDHVMILSRRAGAAPGELMESVLVAEVPAG